MQNISSQNLVIFNAKAQFHWALFIKQQQFSKATVEMIQPLYFSPNLQIEQMQKHLNQHKSINKYSFHFIATSNSSNITKSQLEKVCIYIKANQLYIIQSILFIIMIIAKRQLGLGFRARGMRMGVGRNLLLFCLGFDAGKDYYSILQVQKHATNQQIKSNYYKLALNYHPDVSNNCQQKFKLINEAYSVLSNPKLKQQYDQSRPDYSDFSPFKSQTSRTYHYSSRGPSMHKWKFRNFYQSQSYRTQTDHQNADNEQQQYSYQKMKQQFIRRKREQNQYRKKQDQQDTANDFVQLLSLLKVVFVIGIVFSLGLYIPQIIYTINYFQKYVKYSKMDKKQASNYPFQTKQDFYATVLQSLQKQPRKHQQ